MISALIDKIKANRLDIDYIPDYCSGKLDRLLSFQDMEST